MNEYHFVFINKKKTTLMEVNQTFFSDFDFDKKEFNKSNIHLNNYVIYIIQVKKFKFLDYLR